MIAYSLSPSESLSPASQISPTLSQSAAVAGLVVITSGSGLVCCGAVEDEG